MSSTTTSNATGSGGAVIAGSKRSKRTFNPIRNIVDNLNPPRNHAKPIVNLALGDPTVHGNLHCPALLDETIKELLDTHACNGYIPSTGLPAARKAIAKYSSSPGYVVDEDDVIIASGCSGAIDLVLTAIVDEGDNILVPRPFFPLYQVITESLGGHVKFYDLKAESGWECDLAVMDAAVDSRTKAILINNPSNPCGSNFSKEHLEGIAAVARKHNLMIIADEIYGNCVFDGKFHSMHLHSGDVPVISVGGLAKEFVVPGWRVGWLVFHEKQSGRFAELRPGVKSLTQIIVGANSLVQATIPRLLCPLAGSKEERDLQLFSQRYMDILRRNTEICVAEAEKCPELTVVTPQGAMYAMIRVDLARLRGVADDAEFARKLLEEENLFILPGQCFNMPDYVRLVICPPAHVVQEAFARLRSFCDRHRKTECREDAENENENANKKQRVDEN